MNSQRLAARYRSAQWKMESSAALSDKTNTMRTFIESLLLVVAAAACDLNPSASVEPRSLPGIELCDALAQVSSRCSFAMAETLNRQRARPPRIGSMRTRAPVAKLSPSSGAISTTRQIERSVISISPPESA